MPSTVPCDTGGEAQSAPGVASSSAGHPSPASNGHAADSPPPSLPTQPPAATPNGTSAAAAAGGGAVCAGAAAFLPSPPAALNGTAGVNSGGSAALWDADSMWILMYDNMLREGTRSSPTKRSCGCKGSSFPGAFFVYTVVPYAASGFPDLICKSTSFLRKRKTG
ncbi:hypothetical protein HPB50_007160 [Hyalomma asiaticum]|uniref:Uncharacterized protein n=1 Tax=Hyalomma asiaticum TaxID=266040 RepID=A0ACB7S4S9_HYAAI|nr:hypothetical protein HPB50_007160 [Hyalomma asiaticum]